MSGAGPFDATDLWLMDTALGLARRRLGRTWPNPAVGCVIARDGLPVGRAATAPGGRPHAETQALAQAGALARGATAYVTLEPCAHHGETGPCAEALVAAGVSRVVVACADPDPRVAGRGLARLAEAGIEVAIGCRAAEARAVNAGFLSRVERGRPWLTLKLATSLDGRIAARGGDSRWISGPPARALAHRLRAAHDAVMIGAATALADDPMLDARNPGNEASPVRIVMDARLRLPLTSRLVATARSVPTWLVTLADGPRDRLAAYADAGVQLIAIEPDQPGQLPPAAALAELARRGLTRILAEGGGRLAAGLLAAGLVDRLTLFRAGILLGGDAVPMVAELGLDRVAAAARWTLAERRLAGADAVETWLCAD